jgi:hypothetical protein
MMQRGRWAACSVRCATGIALILAFAAPTLAAEAVLYRIFLRDGSSIISYGDFARVGDRVVVSVPIGEGERPTLQLVSIAESSVDWQVTDRYADAARAKHYGSTRGEDDFNLLSNDVARALNEVALTTDPARRVALADAARQQLAEWPAAHYGYRASDVAQLSTLLEEVVSELRVAAGQARFDLKLVAPAVAAPNVDVLPPPSLRESIELAFTAARVAAEPAERVALLDSIARTLGSAPPSTDGAVGTAAPGAGNWMTSARARATSELLAEQRVDQAYAQMSARVIARAAERARRADVRGLDAIVRSVLEEDVRLGRARPNEVAALLVTVDAQKTAAQRLRLARDAWMLRAGAFREYRRQLSAPLDRLTRSKRWLEDVRQLAGPSPKAVAQLEQRAATAGRELALVKPPSELESAHALFSAACNLATRAASIRRKAITSGDMSTAWEASSAAAGSLMMLERALEDLKRLIERPQLR